MEMKCQYCNQLLNDSPIRPYTAESRRGGGWEARHDVCLRIYEGWRMMDAQHDSWCHLEGCEQAPANPFGGRVELWK